MTEPTATVFLEQVRNGVISGNTAREMDGKGPLPQGRIYTLEEGMRLTQLSPSTNRPTLNVKRLHPDAKLPVYASAGAACFDISTITGGDVFQAETFSTGLAFEVPEGHVMLVFSRSGQGFARGIRLANCVGVIDSDYRGELKIRLTADAGPVSVEAGERVAQAMVLSVQQFAIQEVNELSSTERGEGGFGSTGVV